MEIKSSIALWFFQKKFKLHQGGPRPPRKSYANLLIRTRKSYKIPCTKPWFFPSKFRKISLFIKVLKIGTFGRFLTEWKIHNLAIFLPNTIVTGMPYLPAKDELVSLNRLSSRGLWKRYNSNVFDQQLYGVGQHFTFCRFSRKRKLFGNFDCDFRKSLTKGFFLTEYEEFRNFRFDGKFSIFCRQPLLRINVTEDYFLGVQIRLSTRCKICFTLKSPSFSLKSHMNEPLS